MLYSQGRSPWYPLVRRLGGVTKKGIQGK